MFDCADQFGQANSIYVADRDHFQIVCVEGYHIKSGVFRQRLIHFSRKPGRQSRLVGDCFRSGKSERGRSKYTVLCRGLESRNGWPVRFDRVRQCLSTLPGRPRHPINAALELSLPPFRRLPRCYCSVQLEDGASSCNCFPSRLWHYLFLRVESLLARAARWRE